MKDIEAIEKTGLRNPDKGMIAGAMVDKHVRAHTGVPTCETDAMTLGFVGRKMDWKGLRHNYDT